MKDRIFWSDEEKDKLASIVINMHKKNPHETLNSQLERAQQQIPADRRRKVTAVSQIGWLVERWQEHVKELEDGFRVIKQELPPQKTTDDLLAEMTIEQLAVAFVRRLMTNIDMMTACTRMMFNAAGKLGEKIPEAYATKRLKAIIFGVKNNQENEIKQRFPDIDLKFYDSGNKSGIPSPFPWGEIFILTSFIDHSTYNAIKNIAKNRNSKVHECSGGVSMVCNELEKWIKESKE
jgi:hypothetical protein